MVLWGMVLWGERQISFVPGRYVNRGAETRHYEYLSVGTRTRRDGNKNNYDLGLNERGFCFIGSLLKQPRRDVVALTHGGIERHSRCWHCHLLSRCDIMTGPTLRDGDEKLEAMDAVLAA